MRGAHLDWRRSPTIGIRTPIDCFGNDYGVTDRYEIVPPDESKAYRVTSTVARSHGWEVRVNRLTREVFARHGRDLRYVGPSSGDERSDVLSAMRWMAGAHAV